MSFEVTANEWEWAKSLFLRSRAEKGKTYFGLAQLMIKTNYLYPDDKFE